MTILSDRKWQKRQKIVVAEGGMSPCLGDNRGSEPGAENDGW